MQELFTILSHAVEGTAIIAIAASFVWGILSIVLSPCHLASIPLIVGFIDDQGKISTKRAFFLSFLFSFGILLTIVIIGFITALLGRMMGDVGAWGNYFVALIFFIISLHMLEVFTISFNGPNSIGMKKKGLLAAFLLGAIFGIALGPCTFAYMAPMLAVTFKLAAKNITYGIILLLFYGIGHCSVIVFAGTFTEIVQNYLNWNEKSKGSIIIKKICGILILVAGLYLIYITP